MAVWIRCLVKLVKRCCSQIQYEQSTVSEISLFPVKVSRVYSLTCPQQDQSLFNGAFHLFNYQTNPLELKSFKSFFIWNIFSMNMSSGVNDGLSEGKVLVLLHEMLPFKKNSQTMD